MGLKKPRPKPVSLQIHEINSPPKPIERDFWKPLRDLWNRALGARDVFHVPSADMPTFQIIKLGPNSVETFNESSPGAVKPDPVSVYIPKVFGEVRKSATYALSPVTPEWLDHTSAVIALSLRSNTSVAYGRIVALLRSALSMEEDAGQRERIEAAINRIERHEGDGVKPQTARAYFNIYVERYGWKVGYTREMPA